VTRAIGENRPRRGHDRQSNGHGVAIADRFAMEMRRRFDSVGKIKELTNGYLCFAPRLGGVAPFGDRIGNVIVESN